MKKPDPSKGIYPQKLVYWFRFSLGGKQHRVNLRTRDFSEAVKAAEKIRKEGLKEPSISSKVWESGIEKYISEKTKAGHFREGTAWRVRSCLKTFASKGGASSPADVRLSHLQKYYEARRKGSEAGARSTMATIQAFLSHLGCLPGRVKYAPGSKPERRESTLSMAEANEWISEAKDDRLKFILFCGFHAGLRSGEIRHSQATWFDLSRGLITIPAKEKQTTPRGKRIVWEIKDREARVIPLSEPFKVFMAEFLEERPGHCLRGQRSETGLYDFRAPFERFAEKMKREDITPHSMRHSWISELCNSGNHTIQEVAAWSGDTLETIEKNYWHKRVEAGALDKTVAGKRASEEHAALISSISSKLEALIEAGKIDKTTAGEIWEGFETEEEERGMNERWAAEDELLE